MGFGDDEGSMMNFLLEMLDRFTGFVQREKEKRDAEATAFAECMAKNAEYVHNLVDVLPFTPRVERE
jgi:hypothetical protein